MARNYKQGFFKPSNPQKYDGDPTKIVYRSSWELKLMRYLDVQPNIISWASEEFHIPYFYDIDQKWHRYFVDFKIKYKSKDGYIKTALIEVKPRAQIDRPKEPKKNTPKAKQRYLTEAAEWIKNQQKWKAATQYCIDRNWEFIILDEYALKI